MLPPSPLTSILQYQCTRLTHPYLLWHVLELLLQVLLAEWQLANGVDLRARLQALLDIGGEAAGLERDNFWRRIGVVGNGRATVAAEDSVHRLTGRAGSSVRLGRAGDGYFGFGNDGDERYRLA